MRLQFLCSLRHMCAVSYSALQDHASRRLLIEHIFPHSTQIFAHCVRVAIWVFIPSYALGSLLGRFFNVIIRQKYCTKANLFEKMYNFFCTFRCMYGTISTYKGGHMQFFGASRRLPRSVPKAGAFAPCRLGRLHGLPFIRMGSAHKLNKGGYYEHQKKIQRA